MIMNKDMNKDTGFIDDLKTWLRAWAKMADWHGLPVYLLGGAILLAGSVLMYLSMYEATGSQLVAIVMPSFFGVGILGWKIANERPANSKKQITISGVMVGLHVLAEAIGLAINLIKTVYERLYIDGAAASQVIGLTSAIMIFAAVMGAANGVSILLFRAYDEGISARRKSAGRIRKIANTREQARLDAEESRALAAAEYWKNHSGEYAKSVGEREAAAEIRARFGSDRPNPPPAPQKRPF